MEKIEISHRTIIFTVLFLLSLWFIFQVRFVLLLLFVAFIFVTALNPMVEALQRIKIPRILAIFITFIFIIAVIAGIIAGIVPALIEQTSILANSLVHQIPNNGFVNIDENFISDQVQTISSSIINLLRFLVGAASNILAVFSLLVLTFYMLIERRKLPEYLTVLFRDPKHERIAETLLADLEKNLGGWVRGEFLLMLIVGVLTYIGLSILHIPYALPLALLAGLLELIPNLGPVISAIPTILISLTISPALAVGAAILYLVVQQLENNLIVPLVMRRTTGLNPLITLLSLMIGVTLGGVGGAILSVPIFITVKTVVSFLLANR